MSNEIKCPNCKNLAQKYFTKDGYVNKWSCIWCGSSGFMKNYSGELKNNK